MARLQAEKITALQLASGAAISQLDSPSSDARAQAPQKSNFFEAHKVLKKLHETSMRRIKRILAHNPAEDAACEQAVKRHLGAQHALKAGDARRAEEQKENLQKQEERRQRRQEVRRMQEEDWRVRSERAQSTLSSPNVVHAVRTEILFPAALLTAMQDSTQDDAQSRSDVPLECSRAKWEEPDSWHAAAAPPPPPAPPPVAYPWHQYGSTAHQEWHVQQEWYAQQQSAGNELWRQLREAQEETHCQVAMYRPPSDGLKLSAAHQEVQPQLQQQSSIQQPCARPPSQQHVTAADDASAYGWNAHASSNGLLSKTIHAGIPTFAIMQHDQDSYSRRQQEHAPRRCHPDSKRRTLCKSICRHKDDRNGAGGPIGECKFKREKGRDCEMFHPPQEILDLAQDRSRTVGAEVDDVWKIVLDMYKEWEAQGHPSPVVFLAPAPCSREGVQAPPPLAHV